MLQYRRALMRRDISNSALATKWFMSCDAPLYSILKSWLLGMHTCSEHVCSGSNCRRDEHIVSLPPTPVLTDMKGAAWAGYHGNRCTLHSLAAAVGFWCRRVFPEPRLDTIAVFNGMFSILLSLLPRPPRPPSNSLCGMTALSCQSSPLSQDGSQPWGWRRLPTWRMLHSWSYDRCFHACFQLKGCGEMWRECATPGSDQNNQDFCVTESTTHNSTSFPSFLAFCMRNIWNDDCRGGNVCCAKVTQCSHAFCGLMWRCSFHHFYTFLLAKLCNITPVVGHSWTAADVTGGSLI